MHISVTSCTDWRLLESCPTRSQLFWLFRCCRRCLVSSAFQPRRRSPWTSLISAVPPCLPNRLFTADIVTCQTRDPFHQVSLWAMPVTEHAQYQIPGTSSPKWNAAIFNVINCTCAFPALTSQNVCWQKDLEDILRCVRYTLCFTLRPKNITIVFYISPSPITHFRLMEKTHETFLMRIPEILKDLQAWIWYFTVQKWTCSGSVIWRHSF